MSKLFSITELRCTMNRVLILVCALALTSLATGVRAQVQKDGFGDALLKAQQALSEMKAAYDGLLARYNAKCDECEHGKAQCADLTAKLTAKTAEAAAEKAAKDKTLADLAAMTKDRDTERSAKQVALQQVVALQQQLAAKTAECNAERGAKEVALKKLADTEQMLAKTRQDLSGMTGKYEGLYAIVKQFQAASAALIAVK